MKRLAIQSFVNLDVQQSYPYDEAMIPRLAAFQICSSEGVVLRRGFRFYVTENKAADFYWLGKSRLRRGQPLDLYPLFDEGFPVHHRMGSIISPIPHADFARWVGLIPGPILRMIAPPRQVEKKRTTRSRDEPCPPKEQNTAPDDPFEKQKSTAEPIHAQPKKTIKKSKFLLVSLPHRMVYPFDLHDLGQYVAFSLETPSGQVLRRGFRFRITEEKNDIYYLGKSKACLADGNPDLYHLFDESFLEEHRIGCTLNPIPDDDFMHWVTLLPKGLQQLLQRVQKPANKSKKSLTACLQAPVHPSCDKDDEADSQYNLSDHSSHVSHAFRPYSPPRVWPPRKYRCRVAIDRVTEALRSIFPDQI